MKSFLRSIIEKIIIFESKLVLAKYKPRIVAVTGSVGKTSTKDAIYTTLRQHFQTRKSEKSFNSEIGIPLTILGCENGWSNPIKWLKNIIEGILLVIFKTKYPELLVLEVGADRPGDIRRVSKWLKPDVVVFTAIGKTPVHVEYFKNVEELIREKSYLVEALKPSGTLIYTEDDANVFKVKEKTTAESYSFGFSGSSYFKASGEEIMYNEKDRPSGMRFRVDYEGNSIPIVLNGALGKQHIYPVLASAGVAKVFGINTIELSESLLKHATPPGRMRIIDGIKHSLLIDDTYNASPIAMHEALDTLAQVKPHPEQKKVVVLGDMLELGQYSVEEHKEVGKKCASVADIIVTIGVRARKIAEGALENGFSEKKLYQFEDSDIAGKFLEGIIDPYDVVLLKGSQSIRVEKAVLEVMAHPELASGLLVRQEEEWENR